MSAHKALNPRGLGTCVPIKNLIFFRKTTIDALIAARLPDCSYAYILAPWKPD